MLKSGDIVFCRGRGIIPSLIKLFDPGEFAHVCVMVSPTHCLEAQRFVNVRIKPFDYTDYEVIDLNLTPLQQDKLVHLGIQLIGKYSYDYKQLLQYILDDFGWTLKLNNPKNLICSELISTLLYSLGVIKGEEWIYDMSPNMLYEFLKKINN